MDTINRIASAYAIRRNPVRNPKVMARVKAFLAANTKRPVLPALMEFVENECGLPDVSEDQVIRAVRRFEGIRFGQPRNPVRAPAIIARIRQMVADDPRSAGNAVLVALIRTEFGLTVTEGQVAQALHYEEIWRERPLVRPQNRR